MSRTTITLGIATVLLVGVATIGAGIVMSNLQADEPPGAPPATQLTGRSSPDNLSGRIGELKQQLQQLQKQIDAIEQEAIKSGTAPMTGDISLATLFKYKVPFEIGYSENRDGGRIEIREVWGTRPKIEVGGQYLVRGKYILPRGQRGKVYFYATAGGDWGHARLSDLDLQTTVADKQEGEFTLLHGMSGPGWFHLVLTNPDNYSHMFANDYFGTGENVLRTKP